MSVFAIVFWLWFAVSTTIFIQRRLRARTPERAAGPMSTTFADPPGPDTLTPPWVTEAHQPVAPAVAPSSSIPSSTPSQPVTAAPSPRPDVPVPEPDVRDGSRSPRAAGRSTVGLAEALHGITMPCELAPLTLGMSQLDPGHVELVTSGVGPDQISSELTSELERLGYTVSDLGGGEHLADRDGTVVRVKVHDRPRLSVSSDGRGFATAPPDGIVVEVTVV